MAAIADAFIAGHEAGQAVQAHNAAMERNSLESQILKQRIGALKMDDALRTYDVKQRQAGMQFAAQSGQPAASFGSVAGSEQPITPNPAPPDSLAAGPQAPTPSPMANGPLGPTAFSATPRPPQPVPFPGLPAELGGGPGYTRTPLTMEQGIAMRRQAAIEASTDKGYDLAPDHSVVIPALGPTPIARGGPPVAAPSEFGQFQQTYAEGLGAKAFKELTPDQKAAVFPAFNAAKQTGATPTTEFGQFQQIYAKGIDPTKSFKDLTPTQQAGVGPAFAKFKQDPVAAEQGETLRAQRILAEKQAAALSTPEDITALRPDPATANTTNPRTGMTPNAEYQNALVYATLGRLPAMGMGSKGQTTALRTAIQNKAGALAAAAGVDLPTLQAEYRANAGTLNKLLPVATATAGFAQTANDNLDLALQQSGQVSRTGSPLVNRYAQWANGHVLTGNPALTKFETYIYTAAREYAKVTSGGAMSSSGLTDSAQKEAANLLNAAQTPEAFTAATEAMKADMGNVTKNQRAQVGNVSSTIAQFLEATSPSLGGSAPPSAIPNRAVPTGLIYARDPQGQRHQATAGTPLPPGWTLEP